MKYPIGIQNFEKLRTEGCVYVDKTEYVYNLASAGWYYFLSRPRRFGKVSVFSDLNNLDDISMDARYSTVCGITEDEIDTYFGEEVGKLAEKLGVSSGEARQMLKEQYNGYRFCDDCEGVYNPLSLLKALDKQKLSNYWFDTATPSMLVKLMQETNYSIDNLEGATATADLLGSIETMHSNPIPLIYQTGYLTIQGYDPRFRRYRLGFPNREVEESFMDYLLPYYITSANSTASEFFIEEFIGDVEDGRAEEFMKRLRAMLAGNDYQIAGDKEIYFQNVVMLTFKLMGFYTEVEHATSDGRIDLVMNTRGYIYIMEFKLDGSAEEAMRQIDDKSYPLQYSVSGRKIFKIGVNFSSETRNITDWLINTEN